MRITFFICISDEVDYWLSAVFMIWEITFASTNKLQNTSKSLENCIRIFYSFYNFFFFCFSSIYIFIPSLSLFLWYYVLCCCDVLKFNDKTSALNLDSLALFRAKQKRIEYFTSLSSAYLRKQMKRQCSTTEIGSKSYRDRDGFTFAYQKPGEIIYNAYFVRWRFGVICLASFLFTLPLCMSCYLYTVY